jgi:penicillin-binding protein 1C
MVLLGGGWLIFEFPVTVPPSFGAVKARFQPSEGLLLARDGTPLHAVRLDLQVRRAGWVSLSAVSSALRTTVLAIEDHRFHTHHGVDWRALGGAVLHAALGGPRRGASTLSMQVAALLDPAHAAGTRRTPAQKWHQMRGAWALERTWRKDQILEAYLNLASFRGELVGIGAASRLLLHKAPDSLDMTEALLLTLLLRSPNATPAALTARGCRLILHFAWAADCGALTAAANASLGSARPPASMTSGTPQLAPHVARRLLAQNLREVRSTLDADLQRTALQALRRQLTTLDTRHVNDGAALVLDNASGEVLAYVSNSGTSASAPYVDGVRAPRQAGSTLKPFLYQLALEQRNLTAASLLDDSPVNLETPRGLYVPQNYDREFKGLVTVRSSLAGSLNIPAVRTLMLLGPEAFLARLRRLGFEHITEDADFYGYALALGAAEVTLWELTNAYRNLARGTAAPTPLTLQARCMGAGCVSSPLAKASESSSEETRAAAFIVGDILSDRGSRSATFGLESQLATPFWSAVKTGTSKHMRDNWCIGYSPRYTVGVWVGNFDGTPMHDVSGLTGAAPIWAELMRKLQTRARDPAPAVPNRVVRARVHFEHAAEADRTEWFIAGTVNAVIRPNARQQTPRIVYPGQHSILVLDPDIPPARQRVFFEMRPPQADLVWRLNGQPLGQSVTVAWAPIPGSYALSLLDRSRRVVDEVHFVVRGFIPAQGSAASLALAHGSAALDAYIEK